MHPSPRTRSARTAGVTAAALAALALAAPAVGQAATSFGSPLTDEPNTGNNSPSSQCAPASSPCTRVGVRFPSAIEQDQKSPIDGVVVKFRIRASTPDHITFRIARVTEQGTVALAQSVGTGPTVTLVGTGNIEEYAARVPLKAGDRVAIDTDSTSALHGGSGGKRQYKYGPPLVDGQGPRGQNDDEDEELLVQAVVEPDSDRDGFGDETQDQCPTDASTRGTCPTPDRAAPVLSGVALAPGSFRAAARGGAVASRAPIGARVFYRLSETATVTFGVEKATIGRRVGGRCVKTTRRNRGNRHCLRFVRLAGSFKVVGGAGLNGFRFSGRLAGRKLTPGSYKLVAVARDRAGNKSRTTKRNFRIVR